MSNPQSHIQIRRITAAGKSNRLDLTYLLAHRELIVALAQRELTARHKGSALGIFWSLLKPVSLMIVFTAVFSRFDQVTNTRVPYGPICLSGLILWQLMSGIVSNASQSLVGSASFITKCSFPRMVIPIASMAPALVDFGLGCVLLSLMLLSSGTGMVDRIIWVPVFVVMAIAISLGAGLILATMYVRHRDIGFILPFGLQCLLFASPVVYPLTFLSERMQYIAAFNPLTGILEGFRWCLLGTGDLVVSSLLISGVTSMVTLLLGIYIFHAMESNFADII